MIQGWALSRTKKKKTRKQKRETRSLAPLMPSPLQSARLMELQLNLVSPLSRFLSFLSLGREEDIAVLLKIERRGREKET